MRRLERRQTRIVLGLVLAVVPIRLAGQPPPVRATAAGFEYGNIFRASDCPNSYVSNRVKTIDLRLLSGNTAVHADMIMWHSGERVETAALQLLNVLFSVPQVSVRLQEIPKDHFDMVK